MRDRLRGKTNTPRINNFKLIPNAINAAWTRAAPWINRGHGNRLTDSENMWGGLETEANSGGEQWEWGTKWREEKLGRVSFLAFGSLSFNFDDARSECLLLRALARWNTVIWGLCDVCVLMSVWGRGWFEVKWDVMSEEGGREVTSGCSLISLGP